MFEITFRSLFIYIYVFYFIFLTEKVMQIPKVREKLCLSCGLPAARVTGKINENKMLS